MNVDEERWDRVSRSNYESRLTHWIGWAQQGELLLYLAEPLERQIRLYWRHQRAVMKAKKSWLLRADLFSEPYFMLVGFALENHLKAHLIYQDVTMFSPRQGHARYVDAFRRSRRLPKALKSHDLYRLAITAGFDLTLEEEDLLRKLTRAAVWSGRYPIPEDHRDSLTSMFSDGKRYNVTARRPKDVGRIKRLVAKLRTLPTGPAGPLELLPRRLRKPETGRRTRRTKSSSRIG